MKLETEADNSSCLFISAERTNGSSSKGTTSSLVGCSVRAGDRFPFAQASSPSIGGIGPSVAADIDGRAASDGCGTSVCGSQKSNGFHNNTLTEGTPEEHGCLISLHCEHFRFIDDEDDVDETAPDSFHLLESPCNGISSDPPAGEPQGPANGEHDPQHLPEHHSKTQVEVSQCNPSKNCLTKDAANKMGDHPTNGNGANEDVPQNSTGNKNCRVLKSVLKKGKSTENGKRGRVTFDEAVTLYSDEFDEIQLLALRSAPDFNCAEVFFMFEPPIEYQDLLPFEPPAEYRDTDLSKESGEASIQYETVLIPSDACQIDQSVAEQEDVNLKSNEDSVTSERTETFETIDSDEQTKETEYGDQTQSTLQSHSTDESEKLFERFLEAEREFAEDEELNRVFHALEGDLSCEDKNGTFDDSFFKKLITLLSSVEGDVQLPPEGDLFSSTDFTAQEEELLGRDTEEDDNSQTHSRTLSEGDSDCSVSSQDTIIVRLGDEEQGRDVLYDSISETPQSAEILQKDTVLELTSKNYDDVFNENVESPGEETIARIDNAHQLNQPSRENQGKVSQMAKHDSVNNSVELHCRQTAGGEPPLKETVQDADDSTSSDSRSGEVEEDIRLDDIGYDEEDADDYDEECLRGMVRGNSKIRRIIKKNALQCTLMRGLEARRRQQPGAKYPRPKSPLLPQESLVEQLKWLTTVDDNKDLGDLQKFGSKPPDVILSTGSVPLNGPRPHCAQSEDELNNPQGACYHHPVHYATQERRVVATDSQGVYIVQPSGYPLPPGARPIRPWMIPANQVLQHPRQPFQVQRGVAHSMPPRMFHPDERMASASPVPRDLRDWRVIQRVMVNRGNGRPFVATGFRRCPNGTVNSTYPRLPPPDVSRLPNTVMNNDELEQFVQQGSQRIERIRKRYSMAEDDDDPTFGFGRRPSVRGVQNRLPPPGSQYLPSDATYATVDEVVAQGAASMRPRIPPELEMSWNRTASWRDIALPYGATGGSHASGTIPVHRASVALTELPGCATLPHPKSHSDARYHSYAENPYGNSQTLPHKRWPAMDPRTCASPGNSQPAPHQVPVSNISMPSLQVPSHQLPILANDERGVPEGASSSPKMSSDSLYHGPLPEAPLPVGGAHKDDGVIYYSMNV